MKRLIFLFLVCVGNTTWAQQLQPEYLLTNRWSWIDNGDTLSSATSGAMNAPQFGKVDMDLDGVEDIVIFDRDDYTFTPYIAKVKNGQTVYIYNPRYNENFSNCNCQHWAALQDMNCDGVNDVVCGTFNGTIRVYESQIQNLKRVFVQQQGGDLTYSQPFGNIPMSSLITDVPAIADIDGDGDKDFFTFGNAVNSIEYYKNYAMEQTGKCDTLIFQPESYCWGHFYEDNLVNTAHLFDTAATGLCPFPPNFSPVAIAPSPTSPGSPYPDPSRHTGSTLLMLNLDGDSLQDMIIGDVSFNDVYAVYNKGAKWHAYITSVEPQFPQSNIPVDVPIFPATFYIDVDSDGKKDLIAAPNQIQQANNFKSVALYKNIGQNDFPNFQYQYKGFLQSTCLDFGAFANPTFFDFNNDGLQDVLVGNGFYEDGDPVTSKFAGFSLYKNIGSNIYPMYQLEDDNFLGLKTDPNFVNIRHVTPVFVDINNDGLKDLFFGNAAGTIYFYRNLNNNFVQITNNFSGIDVGAMSAPAFHDIDGDNDLDLFVGNELGYIWYYRNIGSPSSALFDSVTNQYGHIKASDFVPNSNGYAKPLFLDYDNDGTTELLLGATSGVVEIYNNLINNAQDSLHLVDTLFHHDFGAYAAPAAAIVDSSGKWSYLVGNGRGGLQVFALQLPDTTQPIIPILPPIAPQPAVELYPNPTEGQITVSFADTGTHRLLLFNQVGQIVYESSFWGKSRVINLPALPKGMYYLKLMDLKGVIEVKKLWIQ